MGRVAIIATLLAIAVNPPSKPNRASHAADQGGQPERPPAVTFINNEAPQQQADIHKGKTPHWYTAPEEQLVIVGILTLLAIWYQAKETAKAARATAQSARAMDQQTSILETSVTAAKEGAEAAKKSAEIAAESASQSLKEMQLEQRAWVGVTAAKMMNFHPGEQVRAVVFVKNTGKTFAVNTTIYQRIISLGGPLTRFEDQGTSYPGITLLPGADFAAEVGGGQAPLPVSEFEAIKTGKNVRLYVRHYSLQGCARLSPLHAIFRDLQPEH